PKTIRSQTSEGSRAMIRRSLMVVALALGFAAVTSSAAAGSEPKPNPAPQGVPPDLAARAMAASDAVLGHHLDPPTRQQMILAGIRALPRVAGVKPPSGLAHKVSDVTTAEQLSALLAEVWPRAGAATGNDQGPGKPRGEPRAGDAKKPQYPPPDLAE